MECSLQNNRNQKHILNYQWLLINVLIHELSLRNYNMAIKRADTQSKHNYPESFLNNQKKKKKTTTVLLGECICLAQILSLYQEQLCLAYSCRYIYRNYGIRKLYSIFLNYVIYSTLAHMQVPDIWFEYFRNC